MSERISIRVLGPADAIAVRDVRLEGLRLFPQNFGTAWEEEAIHPLAFWESRLSGSAHWLGANLKGELAGITAVSPNSRMKRAHDFDVGAVYVCERFHRRGVASALMQSAMEYAKDRALYTTLKVSAHNESARRLYERFGFVVCGQLERAICVDDVFYDELLMRRESTASYPFG